MVLVRLPGFSQVLTEDAHVWVEAAAAPTWEEKLTAIPHPPLSVMPFLLVGLSGREWTLHLVPLIAQLLAALLMFSLGKRWFGVRVAHIAVGIWAISAWLITPATQIDTDGSILLAAILAALLAYERLWETKQRLSDPASVRWMILLALALAAMMLVKHAAFLVAILLLIEDWRRRKAFRSLTSYVAARFIPYGASVILYVGTLGAIAFFMPDVFSVMFGSGGAFIGNPLHQDWIAVLGILGQGLMLMSPLLLVTPLCTWRLVSVRTEQERRGARIAWTFAILWAAFHIFVLKASFRPLERYLLPCAFALALLAALLIARTIRTRKDTIRVVFTTALAYAILLCIDRSVTTIHALYPKAAFFARVLGLQWDFLVPFRGSSGPFGFYVGFLTMAVAFLVCVILALVAILSRARVRVWTIIAIIAIGIAYNCIIAQEYLFAVSHPDINEGGRFLLDYGKSHDLPQPVYSWNAIGRTELADNNDIRWFGFANNDDPKLVRELMALNGTILFLDYQKLGEDTATWRAIHACPLVAEFSDKGAVLASVRDCSLRASR